MKEDGVSDQRPYKDLLVLRERGVLIEGEVVSAVEQSKDFLTDAYSALMMHLIVLLQCYLGL